MPRTLIRPPQEGQLREVRDAVSPELEQLERDGVEGFGVRDSIAVVGRHDDPVPLGTAKHL